MDRSLKQQALVNTLKTTGLCVGVGLLTWATVTYLGMKVIALLMMICVLGAGIYALYHVNLADLEYKAKLNEMVDTKG